MSTSKQLSAWTCWCCLSESDLQECTICVLLLCREYANFRVSSDGEVQGVGLLIAADPTSGKLVVLAPIQGGPADRAGIKPGDEVSLQPPAPVYRPACSSISGTSPALVYAF